LVLRNWSMDARASLALQLSSETYDMKQIHKLAIRTKIMC